ncbi:hypothetical protein S7711_03898 [Stachybotrys chartarum IBT 7711]|uniref:Cupin 2 conserved barrel domain-containing protein n=1 Tax=Stachybotrys chartarum (strain CBS 109288 / IBT 7711) TaxID=1280523 RepID=A0A084AHX7_STACB|nr:hypothetical protein S7711_03898 [Stachybotrys chartarum IBT 7711]
MPRTQLHDSSTIQIPQGGVEFPMPRDSNRSVIFTFQPGTTDTTGLHWHEEKTEYLQILQGHALVTLGDSIAVFTPSDGPITVPRYTLHAFGRADAHPEGAASRDVALRVREWTDPADGQKEIFFRNLLGILLDKQDGLWGTVKLLLGVFTIMGAYDTYPVFVRGPAFLGQAVQSAVRRWTTYAVAGGVGLLGRMCGLKSMYEEYTPREWFAKHA